MKTRLISMAFVTTGLLAGCGSTAVTDAGVTDAGAADGAVVAGDAGLPTTLRTPAAAAFTHTPPATRPNTVRVSGGAAAPN